MGVFLLLLLTLVGSLAIPEAALGGGQELISREYPIKAAYLYNFALYVRWGPGAFGDSQDPFVIGVLGADPFGKVLDDIAAAKKVENRKIAVRRIDSLDDYVPCHILFVPRTLDPKTQLEVIEKLRGSTVLLVGETANFAERGGAINFFIEENKLRFAINDRAAQRADPKISAKLLNLAKLVQEDRATPSGSGGSPVGP